MSVLTLIPNEFFVEQKPEVELRKEDTPQLQPELVPSSFYANQLSDSSIQQDIATAREAYSCREVVTDAAYSIHEEHFGMPGVSQRYAMSLAEAVYQDPQRDDEQIIASVLPTQEDLTKWHPLVNTVGIDFAEQFAYKHQTGDIHTYKQIEGSGHIHVDSDGHFYDRHANQINLFEAKERAVQVDLEHTPTRQQAPVRQEQGLGL